MHEVAEFLPKPPPKVVSVWKEFKKFAFQGSVLDLAVGIIVGGAFGKIVNSLVNDIIMPPIGWLLSGVDFANIFVLLKRGKKHRITKSRYKSLSHAKEDGAVTVNIGVFLNTVLNFVVISVIIFTFVRTINKIKKKKTPSLTSCTHCYSFVDKRASKCAFCTSDITPAIDNKDEKTADAAATEDDEPQDEDDEDSHSKKASKKHLKKTIKKQLTSTDLNSLMNFG